MTANGLRRRGTLVDFDDAKKRRWFVQIAALDGIYARVFESLKWQGTRPPTHHR